MSTFVPQKGEVAPIRRLLLVKLSSLGDVVHALPLLQALREGLGEEVEIGWAVRSRFADLLQGNPYLTSLYTLERSGIANLWKYGGRLRREHFDTVLDTQGLLVSGLVTRLTAAPRRIGLDTNREGNTLFLTHPIVPGKQRIHVVDKLLGFCDALGIPAPPVRPQPYLIEGEVVAARELLSALEPKPIIGCIIGASTPVKAYPRERWSEVVRLLVNAGVCPVLLGGPDEKPLAVGIVQDVGSGTVTDLTGKTPLRVLASVLARCQVVIGGDSGPTHLAVAVGTPVVGLYGVTDPVRTGPSWGAAPAILLDYAEDDAPPADRRPRHPTLTDAIARIPATAVVEAVQKLLCVTQ